MNESLNHKQIQYYLGQLCKIIRYGELKDIDNLDTYMKDIKYLVILYEEEKHRGHWCCVIKDNVQNIFEFFDSYGTKPDEQLQDIPMVIRNNLNMEFPLLGQLMFESCRETVYNDHKLQKLSDKISTCGKWVILRCMMSELPIDAFAALFMHKYMSDKYCHEIYKLMTKHFKKY